MGSIIDTFKGKAGIKMNDQIIANSTMLAIKGSANAYLAACLTAVTPEVGRLCSEYLTQCLLANESMTALSIKNRWIAPYAPAEEQITIAYKGCDWVLGQQESSV
ncbi:MAG TPA: spore coat protein [Bacillota bacterium]|nr:spore coat protein [Bacillota bacterium]